MWDMQTTRRVGFLVRCTRTGSLGRRDATRGEATRGERRAIELFWLQRDVQVSAMVGQIVDRIAQTHVDWKKGRRNRVNEVGKGMEIAKEIGIMRVQVVDSTEGNSYFPRKYRVNFYNREKRREIRFDGFSSSIVIFRRILDN